MSGEAQGWLVVFGLVVVCLGCLWILQRVINKSYERSGPTRLMNDAEMKETVDRAIRDSWIGF